MITPARLALAAVLAAAWLPTGYAQHWSPYANISETMGTNAGRLCMAEASRGDIGCPTYAPYVSATSGYIGIGTNNPDSFLHVAGAVRVGTDASQTALWLPNGAAVRTGLASTTVYFDVANAVFRDGTGATTNARLHVFGKIGVGFIAMPSTSLHVSGTLRLANGNESCDANRAGAIRYTSGQFQVCYGSGGWAGLADTSNTTVSGDRITSGTTSVIANENGNVEFKSGSTTTGYYTPGGFLAAVGVSTTGTVSAANLYSTGPVGIGTNMGISSGINLQIGTGAIGEAVSKTIRLAPYGAPNYGVDIYASYSSLDNFGVRTPAGFQYLKVTSVGDSFIQAGYGGLSIKRTGQLITTQFDNNGGVAIFGIGRSQITSDTVASTTLHVLGSIRIASEVSTTVNTCDSNRAGAIRYAGNQFQVCYGSGGWANLTDASTTVISADRITSGTMAVIANSSGNSVSFTEGGTTTGYFYNGQLVAGGVSTTGTVSATNLFVANSLGVNVVSPLTAVHVSGNIAFGNALTSTRLNSGSGPRVFSLIDTNAGLRLWRVATSQPLLEFVHGTGSDINSSGDASYWDLYLSRQNAANSTMFIRNRTGNANDIRMSIGNWGTTVGITPNVYTIPSSTLHVGGAIRLVGLDPSTTMQTCDADRAGAIRYSGSNFQVCYGTGGWANLTDASTTVPASDRITSGTASVIVQQDNSVTISTGGFERMVIGQNGYVGVNATTLNAPLTISSSQGATAISFGPGSAYKIASNAGGGPFIQGLPYVLMGNTTGGIGAQFSTGYTGQPQLTLYPVAGQEGLRVRKAASSNVALVVSPSGYVGINTALPTTELEVNGAVSATTIKLADNPDTTCSVGTYGMFKVMNGRPYFCRP